VTHSDPDTLNTFDLIQCLVPTHNTINREILV
jgi:hypothetical protein